MNALLGLPGASKQSRQSLALGTQDTGQVQTKQQLPIPSEEIQLIPIEFLQQRLGISQKISNDQHKEISYLLTYILNLPSLEQAQIHSQANKLGMFDVKGCRQIRRQYCKCCGFIKQQDSIPICTSFNCFPSAGLSIYLFFQTIRNLMLLLLFLIVSFSVFGFYSNCHVADVFKNKFQFSWDEYEDWMIVISLGSKKLIDSKRSHKMYLIQMWIGVGVVVVWSLLLFLIKYFEQKSQVMVDNETISASDFSILIENYPRNITKQELQKQITMYQTSLEQNQVIAPFQVQKINLNQRMDIDENKERQMEIINQRYHQYLEKFIQWVQYFQQNSAFRGLKKVRYLEYRKFHQLKKERESAGKNLICSMFKNIKKDQNLFAFMSPQPQKIEKQEQENEGKSIAVVTFRSSTSKDKITKYNTMSISDKIRYYMQCCPSKNKLVLRDPSTNEKYRNIIISRAPEPEDIIWQNLAYTDCQKFLRSLATYFVTLILLSLSLGIVYYLSLKQKQNSSNFYINILISLTISIINFLIGFAIRHVTLLQKNYTVTGYQTSLAVKSILAQVINSIAVPIAANYVIEDKNLYGSNGLATQIIYLSIIMSLIPPLIKLFDPYYFYLRLRSHFYRKSLKSQLLMKQSQMNDTQEYMQFQNGYQYIYYINSYLFTAFFISLQPVIAIFSLIGIFFMYWIHKYTLLHRAKRPIPGSDLISTAMGQAVNLGPLFFALGTLCWSHFLGSISRNPLIYFLPNIIAGGLSLFFLLFPFSLIFRKCLKHTSSENLDFQQCRIYLSSQYDRMNPATMEQAIKQYEQFIQNFISEKNPSKKLQNHPKKTLKMKKQEAINLDRQIEEQGIQNQFVFMDKSQQNSGIEIVQSLQSQADFADQNQKIKSINNDFLNRKKNLLRSKAMRNKKGNENSMMGMIGQFGMGKQMLTGLLKLTDGNKQQGKKQQKPIQIPVRGKTSKKQLRKQRIQEKFKAETDQFPHSDRFESKKSRNLDYMKFFGTKTNLVANSYLNSQNVRPTADGKGYKNPYEDSFY